MTALYVPEGIPPPALIGALAERGIVIAGGLHKDIKVRTGATYMQTNPSKWY